MGTALFQSVGRCNRCVCVCVFSFCGKSRRQQREPSGNSDSQPPICNPRHFVAGVCSTYDPTQESNFRNRHAINVVRMERLVNICPFVACPVPRKGVFFLSCDQIPLPCDIDGNVDNHHHFFGRQKYISQTLAGGAFFQYRQPTSQLSLDVKSKTIISSFGGQRRNALPPRQPFCHFLFQLYLLRDYEE